MAGRPPGEAAAAPAVQPRIVRFRGWMAVGLAAAGLAAWAAGVPEATESGTMEGMVSALGLSALLAGALCAAAVMTSEGLLEGLERLRARPRAREIAVPALLALAAFAVHGAQAQGGEPVPAQLSSFVHLAGAGLFLASWLNARTSSTPSTAFTDCLCLLGAAAAAAAMLEGRAEPQIAILLLAAVLTALATLRAEGLKAREGAPPAG